MLFTDDIVLLSTTPGGLQAQLDLLKECCDKLKLSVNKATNIMVFRKGGYLSRQEKWFYEGNQTEVGNIYCYLGVTFSTMLSAKLGTSHFANKGKKTVYVLCKAFQKCKEMTQKPFFTIFQSKVQSILLCSSEICGLHMIYIIIFFHIL